MVCTDVNIKNEYTITYLVDAIATFLQHQKLRIQSYRACIDHPSLTEARRTRGGG
jgi:hypothetical protein